MKQSITLKPGFKCTATVTDQLLRATNMRMFQTYPGDGRTIFVLHSGQAFTCRKDLCRHLIDFINDVGVEHIHNGEALHEKNYTRWFCPFEFKRGNT